MKILWLSPRLPLPDHTGAAKAMMALLEEITSVNPQAKVNVVCLGDEQPSKQHIDEFLMRTRTEDNLYLRKNLMPFGKQSLGYIVDKFINFGVPFTISRCKSQRIESDILNWAKDKTWDVTIVDGLHAMYMVNLDDKRFGRIVYRSHNVETDLWQQVFEKENNYLKRYIFKKEYELFKKCEKLLCKKSLVFTVSKSDADRMRELNFTAKAYSLPIGFRIPAQMLDFNESMNLNLFFVGRLDWHPNKEGLLWFLNRVWPYIDQVKTSLTVVGSGDSAWLSQYEAPNLHVYRNVPDLKDFYKQAHVTLIPLFKGSGTRVKAIESAAFGRSFISTAIGIEGVPVNADEDYLLAESAQDWINALNNLSIETSKKLGQKVNLKIRAKFDQREVAKNFMNQISERKSWEQTFAI